MAEPAGLDLFRQRRFGLFVHFGLYSLGARNEWMRHRERTPDERYQRYFDHFCPDRFDPADWVAQAAAAGMRYAVVTTKHHDGFCLWDTALTDFQVTNTPWGRDLIGPLVGALRERDLGVGLYHSLLDWHHPQFPLDGLHPLRDDPAARAAGDSRDIAGYRRYLHGQVRELLTRYGQIDQLWFDFSYPDHVHEGQRVWGGKGAAEWGAAELLALARELQPGILVNDRLGLPGDFVTPEQYQPAAPLRRDGRPVPWEACQTLNGSWGYDRDNHDYKSADLLLRMLVDTVSKDGNLLLNVGPTARGEFDPVAAGILAEIGRWMRRHDRSIYGAGPSSFVPPPDARYTQRGNRLYLHLFAWPFDAVHLPMLADRVVYAQFLHDASEVQWVRADLAPPTPAMVADLQPAGTLTLQLPNRRPDVAIPVVELFLR
ncbi:MAG TPA: alpha-L-fucosidase [Mycobacteriales bacterium]|nr:alpha-L-fucosidase [Mycobacteriales bacterium]